MHLAPLISDLAIILSVAAIVTYIFRKIRQPVVLGYILAGLIVSPYTSGPSVADSESIKIWAELGVIFLMFNLGLEFSLRKLFRTGVTTILIGVGELIAMGIVGYNVATQMGWNATTSMFVAGMVAISSTTIIIKSFEELGLRSQRFSDTVLGILIIEDLAAILLLVALTSFGRQAEVDGLVIFQAALRLLTIVGSWFLVGMFLVPRFVKSIGKQGSNEMLVLSAVALCLGLVWIASKFEYSVALGAFMMGSILAETKEVKRIESLIEPLKDLFGAIFFISVGMLLDPKIVMTDWQQILMLTLLVAGGKIVSVFTSSLLAGQSIADASKISFSMGQIGEFSFIIATLGLSFGVVTQQLFSVIIAVSLLTTFCTPYFMKQSGKFSSFLHAHLPPTLITLQNRYAAWIESRIANPDGERSFLSALMRWITSAIMCTILFSLISHFLVPTFANMPFIAKYANLLGWAVAFILAVPFMWAMAMSAREANSNQPSLVGLLSTILLVGLLSQEFLPFVASIIVTLLGLVAAFLLLRKHIESHYRWYERQFFSGFSTPSKAEKKPHERLINLAPLGPWNAQLRDVKIPVGSKLAGKSLLSLGFRENFGVNIICIARGDRVILPPTPSDCLLPMDEILIFGDDRDADLLFNEVNSATHEQNSIHADELDDFRAAVFSIAESHPLSGTSIRKSRLREDYGCIVVGIERQGKRVKNPHSDTVIEQGDNMWVVGQSKNVLLLAKQLTPKAPLQAPPATN